MEMEEFDSKVKNLTTIRFKDQTYLNYGPLNENTVLDYFSLSPFYEKNSINYKCFIQKLDFNTQKQKMTGIEFNVDYVSKDKELFYITKHLRSKNKFILLSYYYVFKGTIYQAPDLYSVLLSNVESISNNFVNLIDELNN